MRIFRKNYGDDKGQVLAAVQTEPLVDDCKVFIFSKNGGIGLETYEGDSMKLTGAGRPIWAEITNPSEKWAEITGEFQTPVEIDLCIAAVRDGEDNIELVRLAAHFVDPEPAAVKVEGK